MFNVQQYWPFFTTTVVQNPLNQGIYTDLPPQDSRQYRSWEWSYNLNLIGKDQLPNRQQDWPVPISPEPSPRRSWEWWYNLNLIGKDKLPSRNLYPNPDPVSWYRDWSLNLLQTTLKPTPQKPFFQSDWPLPQPVTWYRSQESSYTLSLIGKDTLPFRTDVSIQRSIDWYRDWYNNLLQTTLKPVIVQLPFNQYDWPNPTSPPPLFQYLLQNLTLNLPLPPTPPAILTGGRQVGWDEIERVERLSQTFLKEYNSPIPKFYNTNPVDPSIKARDAAVRLGRLGGIASGKARGK